MGGLVSLQIARLLDDERRHAEKDPQYLFVAGVILIDSPYPSCEDKYQGSFVEIEPEFPVWTPERMRKNVARRFIVCDQLINSWEPPLWDTMSSHDAGTSIPQVSTSNSTFQPSAAMGEGLQVRSVSSSPPTVLLKAMERVPLKKSHLGTLHQVDLFRDNALLGWEHYRGNLLKAVHHIPGHHFDLFELNDKACLSYFWKKM